MEHPLYQAIAEEKTEITRDTLMQKYPNLPIEIIDTAIETCSWHTLFSGTNRYNTQEAIENYASMAEKLIEERRNNSIAIVELLLLDRNRRSRSEEKETDLDLVKGVRSIPHGVLKIVMKSVVSLWETS